MDSSLDLSSSLCGLGASSSSSNYQDWPHACPSTTTHIDSNSNLSTNSSSSTSFSHQSDPSSMSDPFAEHDICPKFAQEFIDWLEQQLRSPSPEMINQINWIEQQLLRAINSSSTIQQINESEEQKNPGSTPPPPIDCQLKELINFTLSAEPIDENFLESHATLDRSFDSVSSRIPTVETFEELVDAGVCSEWEDDDPRSPSPPPTAPPTDDSYQQIEVEVSDFDLPPVESEEEELFHVKAAQLVALQKRLPEKVDLLLNDAEELFQRHQADREEEKRRTLEEQQQHEQQQRNLLEADDDEMSEDRPMTAEEKYRAKLERERLRKREALARETSEEREERLEKRRERERRRKKRRQQQRARAQARDTKNGSKQKKKKRRKLKERKKLLTQVDVDRILAEAKANDSAPNFDGFESLEKYEARLERQRERDRARRGQKKPPPPEATISSKTEPEEVVSDDPRAAHRAKKRAQYHARMDRLTVDERRELMARKSKRPRPNPGGKLQNDGDVVPPPTITKSNKKKKCAKRSKKSSKSMDTVNVRRRQRRARETAEEREARLVRRRARDAKRREKARRAREIQPKTVVDQEKTMAKN